MTMKRNTLMNYPSIKSKDMSNEDFRKELCNRVQDHLNCLDIGCRDCIYTESNLAEFEEWLGLETEEYSDENDTD